jgi:hypothetical protein
MSNITASLTNRASGLFRLASEGRHAGEIDWVSRSGEYAFQMVSMMQEIGKTGPFWQPVKP